MVTVSKRVSAVLDFPALKRQKTDSRLDEDMTALPGAPVSLHDDVDQILHLKPPSSPDEDPTENEPDGSNKLGAISDRSEQINVLDIVRSGSASLLAQFSWQRWMSFRLLRRLANTCITFIHLRFFNHPRSMFVSLVSRVQTTLRGSGQDIGWLTQMPGLPAVEDGTDRFSALLGRVMNGVHTLPDSLVYLLVPGLFSNLSPLYLLETKKHFSKIGLTCHIAKIQSQASVETNARELKAYIEELYWGTGKKVILLGHSKGGIDAAAALAMYKDSLAEKVAGIVFVQSPYGGSPVASDLLREGQIADTQSRRILELLMNTILNGDLRALEDLTYDQRRKFLESYPMPSGVPAVCFHSEASRAPGVISSMTHIYHAELPWISPGAGVNELDKLIANAKVPVAMPVSALLALLALQLEVRYGEKSDGLVVRRDAEIPGSIAVRIERKLDHGFMVFAPVKKDPKDVDAAQICEALITLLLESTSEGCREILI